MDKKTYQPTFTQLVAILPPIILAAYSVLVLYVQNINELEIAEILPVLGSVIAGTSLSVALLTIAFRDARKAGIIGSLLTICVLFYGLFFNVLDDFFDGKVWHKIFLPAYTLMLIAIAWFSTRTTDRIRMTSTLVLVISVVSIATPVFRIVQYHMFEVKKVVEPQNEKVPVRKQNDNNAVKRNIYYLIFDRYAANRTLKRDYKFDNEAFLNFLSSKGFYVATDSNANYTKTAHSLASSLNMQYLDHLSKELGGGSEDWKPLHRMIKDFKVWRILKNFGYSYIHLGSWWGGTRRNEFADEVYSVDPNSEFANLYFKNTALLLNNEFVTKSKDRVDGGIDHARQCERVLYKFSKLNELTERKGQFFVFAHMLTPHDPYVFDEQGRCQNKAQSEDRTQEVNFTNQIKYVNTRLEQLINSLLSAETKPIIIIQSDEGPFPERYRKAGKEFDWRDATEQELQKKFHILNALYLPGFDHSKLNVQITPLNTFRMVFSEYFGLEYERLPDRSFSFYDEFHLYDFFEVTTSVE